MAEVLGNTILVGVVGAGMVAQTSKGADDRGTFESTPTLSPALMVESAS